MRKNIIKKILIIFSLVLVWVGFTLWYIVIYDESFLILSYSHSNKNFQNITHERLLKGKMLSGEFIAKENNLGIISLRFKKFLRIPYDQEDVLVFRLKKKGETNWYYENEYRSGLTFDVPFLPFGFPLISDSKGKTYYFELESLSGNKINGVSLDKKEPFLVSKYQKEKSEIVKDYKVFLFYVCQKIINSFRSIDVVYSSFVFSLPLLFYISVPFILNRILLKNEYDNLVNTLLSIFYYWVFLFTFLVIIVDILILHVINDLLYIMIFFLWLLLAKVHNTNMRFSFSFGIIFLLISPITLMNGDVATAEKAAIWAYVLFFIGTCQCILDLIKQKRYISQRRLFRKR